MAPWGQAKRGSTTVVSEDRNSETAGLLDNGAQVDRLVDDTDGLGQSAGVDASEPRKDSWVGLQEFEGLPWTQRPTVWWLLGPFALFTLAFGGTAVPKMNLLIALVCSRYYQEQSAKDPSFPLTPVVVGGDLREECLSADVQAKVSTLILMIGVITGFLSAITAPKLGALSDRYGRTRMLVVCSLGGIVLEIITILAANFPDVVHYNWLILGAAFDGLTGSFTAGGVIAHAYVSDCTPPSQRNVAFGYLHSCLFLGLSFGPLITGYFVKWTGSLVSLFYLTLGCHLVFISFVYFVVPESLSKARQLLAREKHEQEEMIRGRRRQDPAWMTRVSRSLSWLPLSKPLGRFVYEIRTTNVFAPLKILVPKGPGASKLRRNLLTLAFVDTAIMGSVMGAGSVTVLYLEATFGWRTFESSKFVSGISMVRVLVLTVLFPIFNYFFRIRPARRAQRETGIVPDEKNQGADNLDIWILRVALISDVIGVTGYIFVRTQELFIMCAVIAAFGGLGSATIQAAMTKHVPAERVGQLLGATGLLHALSRIVFPALFNGLYAITVRVFPQAFFVMLSAIFFLALAASFLIRAHVYMEDALSIPSSPTQSPVDAVVNEEIIEEDELIPGLH